MSEEYMWQRPGAPDRVCAEINAIWDRVIEEAASPRLLAEELHYLFGETAENKQSSLDRALRLQGPVALSGHDAVQHTGYEGVTDWTTYLIQRGMAPARIVLITGGFQPVANGQMKGNTLTEANALVKFCKQRSIQRIGVLAPEFHLVRCFISTVGEAIRQNYKRLSIYPLLGDPLDWFEPVVHSQGRLVRTRLQLMREELARIIRYTLKEEGDLPPPWVISEYLVSRRPYG
jgi:hypothetical protein